MMPPWLLKRPWRRALVWLLVLAPFFYLSYGLANHFAEQAAARHLVRQVVFDWERHIPFLPWTIFPYWSINFFYGLSLFLARTRHELNRQGLRLLTAQVLAVSCFIAWPLQFTFGQPPADGIAGYLFSALRGFDKPFNQAPSLHIALAVILWDFYRRQIDQRWARIVLHGWTLLICLSVLTTYQHHFIDLPTGALLGIMCVWLWPLERRVSMLRAWCLTRDPVRWRIASYYSVAAALCVGLSYFGGSALWLLWPAVALLWVALCYLGFGARGFQMSATGQLPWHMRWALAPYRLGAWLNARYWARHVAPASEIVPGVWLASLPSRHQWRRAGQPAIVSLCAELQNVDCAHGKCLPVLDLTTPPAHALLRVTHWVSLHRAQGRVVWICCALGFSRSAIVMAHVLKSMGAAPDPAQAFALIKKARPQVVLKGHSAP